MANERLLNAMIAANVDVDAIERVTQVDPKTVQRWLQGRVPHPRHRRAVARLLNEREDVLWQVNGTSFVTPITYTSEIIVAYAHRAQVPSSSWWHLFSQARQHIDLLGYAMLFLPEQHPDLTNLLKEKSKASCKIRIALADPTCNNLRERDKEEQLGGTSPDRVRTTLYHFRDILNYPDIEIRFHATPLYNSVFRFDNDMFVTPHLYGLHGSKAPLLHLRCLGPGGIFANFAKHFEAVWATTTPIIDSTRPYM
jgi:hypothetical protein